MTLSRARTSDSISSFEVPVATGTPQAEIEQLVLARDKVKALTDGPGVARVVYVPNRLVNVVTKQG